MSGKQPEALWLATCLQNGADDPMWAMHCEMSKVTCEKVATELRRLHALNAELAGALQFAHSILIIIENENIHGYG